MHLQEHFGLAVAQFGLKKTRRSEMNLADQRMRVRLKHVNGQRQKIILASKFKPPYDNDEAQIYFCMSRNSGLSCKTEIFADLLDLGRR
jgi:hypothetical protein